MRSLFPIIIILLSSQLIAGWLSNLVKSQRTIIWENVQNGTLQSSACPDYVAHTANVIPEIIKVNETSRDGVWAFSFTHWHAIPSLSVGFYKCHCSGLATVRDTGQGKGAGIVSFFSKADGGTRIIEAATKYSDFSAEI